MTAIPPLRFGSRRTANPGQQRQRMLRYCAQGKDKAAAEAQTRLASSSWQEGPSERARIYAFTGFPAGLGSATASCYPCTLGSLPSVLRSGPYRFFFYSADQDEPPHIHVERDRAT